MTRSAPPLNRYLVSSEYSVFYRKSNHLKWQTQSTTEYTLVTLFAGRLHYSNGNDSGQLSPGQILIFNPDSGLQLSGTPVELLVLNVSSAVLIQHAVSMQLIPTKSTVVFPPEPITNDTELNQLIRTFHSEVAAAKPGREIIMRALIEQLLVQLLRQHSIARRSDELEFSRVGLIDRRIRRSVELMHSQLDQDLSLRDLAAASYLSPFHFARLFKKITGVTPHSYLAAIRTRKAQLLLAEPDLSINSIAARVGYLSSSHFTKAFRAATGTTPREFRKALIDRKE